MEVRRHLVEAASKENLPIKMSLGRVTPEQLSAHIQLFRRSWKALRSHCGVLQLSLAAAQALRHPSLSEWDTLLALERLLLQALGDSDLAGVLRQILPLVKPHADRAESDQGPEELLALLVYVYSLAGDRSVSRELEEAERELAAALVRALLEEPELSPLIQKITRCCSASELTDDAARTAVGRVFEILRGLSRSRAHLRQLRSVHSPGDGVHQATYKPFLKQALEEIFHPDRQDSQDIEHMSSGLTDLLKTGFSMFMKVSRPHPSDHPQLILFMVGGITPSEVRLVKELVSSHKPGMQVTVLSTRLLKPADVPELLFATDRLHPDIGV
ncbi:SCFD2 protein, partial [Atractosteus spatula]|nr:SCFD2 protein [Atractosteus spatula]